MVYAITGNFLTALAAVFSLVNMVSSLFFWKDEENKKVKFLFALPVILLGLSVLILVSAFVANRFEIDYVFSHSSKNAPFYLKISALWAGQEGSLLLWSFMQAAFSFFAVRQVRAEDRMGANTASAVLNILVFFFSVLVLFFSNPFSYTLPQPAEGSGLNPLLRHPGMIFHPPSLYIGYVGLSVPFAFSLAGAIAKNFRDWLRDLRWWTLIAWFGLGVGLLLGMRWAYDVLGWGGYWGWDPVENAGLLPWLTATALLHSLIMMDEKRGFTDWAFLLSVFSYSLVILGTFITRSGLIQSVHAYTQSQIGWILLTGLILTVGVGLTVFFSRLDFFSSKNDFPSLFSRNGFFYLSNLLLVTLTFSILLGTLLPSISSGLNASQIEVAPGWFDKVTGPQFFFLILLLGICPLMAVLIRGGISRTLIVWSAWFGVLFSILFSVLFALTNLFSIIGLAVVGFSLAANASQFISSFLMRKNLIHRESSKSFLSMVQTNKRKFGGLLTHIGLIILAMGVVGSRLNSVENTFAVSLGNSFEFGGYSFQYQEITREYSRDYLETSADLTLSKGEQKLAVLHPRLNQFNSQETITIPAVRSSIRSDIYTILAGWSEDGSSAAFHVMIAPLINFLWLGGLVFLAGGYIALSPDFKKQAHYILFIITGLGILLGSAWAIWGVPRGIERPPTLRQEIGYPAPVINGVPTLDGLMIKYSDLRDQVVLVNFWAPWCPTCLEEMPALQEIWEKYQEENFTILGITYDTDKSSVLTALDLYGVTYPIIMDEDFVLSSDFGVTGVPETYLIDREGNLAFIRIGPVTFDEMDREISRMLMKEGN